MRIHEYSTIDTHTAGMPTRVVLDGIDVPGAMGADGHARSVRERRDEFAREHDHVREFLVCEPRGHADMFAAIPLEPADPDADLGLFFMDADGYLDMCGHATIGAITALAGSPDGPDLPRDRIVVETPAGLVTTHPRFDDGRVVEVSFENVPAAYVGSRSVYAGQHGNVEVDVVSAGNLCAILPAGAVGISLAQTPTSDIAAKGAVLRDLLEEDGPFEDPITGREGHVGLVEFVETGTPNRTAVVFGDGSVDRSPCGTGTSARMTLHAHAGDLDVEERFEHVGPTGESFAGRITEAADGVYETTVTGSAHVTGHHTFVQHASDSLRSFTLD